MHPLVNKIVGNKPLLKYPFPNSHWKNKSNSDTVIIINSGKVYSVKFKTLSGLVKHIGLSKFNEDYEFIDKASCIICCDTFYVTSTELQSGITTCNNCN